MTKEICGNCSHWTPTVYGYGKCSDIGGALEIELHTGYGGGLVGAIETEKDFGCNLFVADGVNE